MKGDAGAEKEQGKSMRKKRSYDQVVKCIIRPELTHSFESQNTLQRCITISDRITSPFCSSLRHWAKRSRAEKSCFCLKATARCCAQGRKSAMMKPGKSKSAKIKGSCSRLMVFSQIRAMKRSICSVMS